MIPLCSAKAIW